MSEDWQKKIQNAKRILVCGSRNWTNRKLMEIVFEYITDAVIIEGECRGADLMARKLAEEKNFVVKKYPADWSKYGRSAGPIRNRKMINEGNPDIVLAFHEDWENSKGTKDMIKLAEENGIIILTFK